MMTAASARPVATAGETRRHVAPAARAASTVQLDPLNGRASKAAGCWASKAGRFRVRVAGSAG